MKAPRLVSLIVVILSLSPHALAQAPIPDPPPALSPAALEARQKRALELVEEVLAEAPSLRSRINRIRLQYIAAELLWTRHEKRARGLIASIQETLIEMLRAVDPADPQYWMAIGAATQLRSEIINALAGRDARCALDFLRATRTNIYHHRDPYNRDLDPESALELQIAARVAGQDAEFTSRMIEESLKNGISYQTANAWSTLYAANRPAAEKLAPQLIRKLKESKLTSNQQAMMALTQMLQTLQAFNVAPGEQKTSPPSSSLLKELLETLTAAVLGITNQDLMNDQSRHPARNLISQMGGLTALYEKYLPERKEAVEAKLKALRPALDPYAQVQSKMQALGGPETSVDEVLAVAAKAPVEMRDGIYQQAAQKVFAAGDRERARRILDEHLTNPIQRNHFIGELERQETWRLANEGKYDDARRLLSRLRSDEERATMLIGWASIAASRKEDQILRTLLTEAEGLLGDRCETQNQMNLQLQLARTYATIDSSRSLALVESILQRFNTLIEAAFALDAYEQRNEFEEGELKLTGNRFSWIFDQFAGIVAAAPNPDLDRLNGLFAQAQRKELRLHLQLAVAQHLLSAAPFRPPPPPGLFRSDIRSHRFQ